MDNFWQMKGTEINHSVSISEEDINLYRQRLRSYIDLKMFNTALYWADKIVNMSCEDSEDVYWLAKCLFLASHYYRAEHLILKYGLEKSDIRCLNLVVKCQIELKKFSEAKALLSKSEDKDGGLSKALKKSLKFQSADSQRKLQAARLFLKGQVYEAMDNRKQAAELYKMALFTDVYFYEALEIIVQHHMLSVNEELELVDRLPLHSQCSGLEEESLLRDMYRSLLNKYHKVHNIDELPQFAEEIALNIDVAVSKAEVLLYNCQYKSCSHITKKVLQQDPFHPKCLEIEVTCLYERKRRANLLLLAQRLVNLIPGWPVSWYAAGCYYLLLGKTDTAQKYLKRSISLNKAYAPAWIAYGNSHALENEFTEAISIYSAASKILTGCYLPTFAIGIDEKNKNTANCFLVNAVRIAPSDPYIWNELGVLQFKNNEYVKAHGNFICALVELKSAGASGFTELWETVFNNLAHTNRKLKNYSTALYYHCQALKISPAKQSTYTAMALVYALMGDMNNAAEYGHKAYLKDRKDEFVVELVNRVMVQMADEPLNFEGTSESLTGKTSFSGKSLEFQTSTIFDWETITEREKHPDVASLKSISEQKYLHPGQFKGTRTLEINYAQKRREIPDRSQQNDGPQGSDLNISCNSKVESVIEQIPVSGPASADFLKGEGVQKFVSASENMDLSQSFNESQLIFMSELLQMPTLEQDAVLKTLTSSSSSQVKCKSQPQQEQLPRDVTPDPQLKTPGETLEHTKEDFSLKHTLEVCPTDFQKKEHLHLPLATPQKAVFSFVPGTSYSKRALYYFCPTPLQQTSQAMSVSPEESLCPQRETANSQTPGFEENSLENENKRLVQRVSISSEASTPDYELCSSVEMVVKVDKLKPESLQVLAAASGVRIADETCFQNMKINSTSYGLLIKKESVTKDETKSSQQVDSSSEESSFITAPESYMDETSDNNISCSPENKLTVTSVLPMVNRVSDSLISVPVHGDHRNKFTQKQNPQKPDNSSSSMHEESTVTPDRFIPECIPNAPKWKSTLLSTTSPAPGRSSVRAEQLSSILTVSPDWLLTLSRTHALSRSSQSFDFSTNRPEQMTSQKSLPEGAMSEMSRIQVQHFDSLALNRLKQQQILQEKPSAEKKQQYKIYGGTSSQNTVVYNDNKSSSASTIPSFSSCIYSQSIDCASGISVSDISFIPEVEALKQLSTTMEPDQLFTLNDKERNVSSLQQDKVAKTPGLPVRHSTPASSRLTEDWYLERDISLRRSTLIGNMLNAFDVGGNAPSSRRGDMP